MSANRVTRRAVMLCLGIAAAPAPLLAAPASDPAVSTLEEVVVTARFRAENARDVPISLVALSSQDLEARGATDLRSIGEDVPNVTVGTGNQQRRTNLVIRGISTEARSIGQETGVGVYLDGVYTGRAETYNQYLPDVAQVEFLRGPQGTVFGRNTIAGAISLTTLKPTDTTTGQFSLEAGNYGRLESMGYVSGPLRDHELFGKVVAYGTNTTGYATNVFDGSKAGKESAAGGRVELRATPSDSLELIFEADYTKHHNVPYKFEVTTGAFGNEPGPFTINEAFPSRENVDAGGAAFTINAKFANGYTLSSISAWRSSGWAQRADETWDGMALAYSRYDEHSNYASEELRITSPAGQPLEWVGGLYYTHQYSRTHTPVYLGDTLAGLFGIPTGLMSFDELADVTTNGYAAYANASYHLAPKWALTVGGRYTSEDKHLNFNQMDPDGLGFVPSIGPLTRDYSKGAFTPTLSLVYSISDRASIYATVSTGYKSGGFNVDTLSSADRIGFNPEHVTNYEVGFKGLLADGHLQFDADAFHMDYKDLQITQYDPVSFANYIGNAAKAKIDGVEADLVAHLDHHWSVDASFGYLNARFTHFFDQYGADLSGNQMVFAPKTSGALAVSYRTPVGAGSEFFARADANYRAESHPDVNNLPLDTLGARTLLNARAGVSFHDGHWIVEAYGRNLSNKLYAIAANTQYPLLSFLPAFNYLETDTTYGMPRAYGVKFTAKF